ncbi:MAG: DUF5686 and carboxypeptidase regulatory-like domain-containing protein [Bacteroidota bacterium]
MHKFLLPFVVVLFSYSALAQTIRGRITDDKGQPLPFTTIYEKGTTDGTSSNIQGAYFLELKPGQHQVVYQYIGYKTQIYEVDIEEGETLELDIALAPELIQLKELVVTGDGRDPAYYIMGRAMAKRKYHLNEVRAYQCNVYVKGMQTLEKKPDKILGFAVTVDTGIVYLSESVSVLSFLQPNKIHERMISSKVSGNNQAFSYNQASEMLVNFYQNILTAEGLSERGFISPLANSAFSYYNFRLVGIIEENGQIINKIEVLPKRKNDPVFNGHIYILEGSWRIHSVDLNLTKDNQIEFLDNLSIKQVYAPVDHGIWMMLSQKFTFDLKVFGFEGRGNFIGVHSNYKIEPAYDVSQTSTQPQQSLDDVKVVKVPKRKKRKKNATKTSIFEDEKKLFKNELLTVEEGSNERDSSYWESIRPIPLTRIEQKDYQFKDSIKVIIDSKPYKDSIDVKSNKINPENVLFSGYMHRNTFKGSYLSFDPLVNMIQFNTVEGPVLNLRVLYTQLKEEQPWWRLIPEVRYGFSSEQAYAKLRAVHIYNVKKFAQIEMSGGRFVYQLNERNPIPYWLNSFYSLFLRENYMKLYDKSFGRFRHQIELTNGLFLTSTAEYAQRRSLENNSDYSFFREGDVNYTSNAPDNSILDDTSFPTHNALTLDFLIRIRFAQTYINRPDRKFILESKYPKVNLRYRWGVNVLGSDVNFHLLEAEVRHDLDLGMLGDAKLMATYGNFVSAESTFFPDFRHFDGNQVILTKYDQGSLQLLDYYLYSTNESYLQAQCEHHFNGFIFNKLPLLRKLKTQLVTTVNYLNTPDLANYTEVGVGIEHIFKIGRIDYFHSFNRQQNSRQGVRLGIGF